MLDIEKTRALQADIVKVIDVCSDAHRVARQTNRNIVEGLSNIARGHSGPRVLMRVPSGHTVGINNRGFGIMYRHAQRLCALELRGMTALLSELHFTTFREWKDFKGTPAVVATVFEDAAKVMRIANKIKREVITRGHKPIENDSIKEEAKAWGIEKSSLRIFGDAERPIVASGDIDWQNAELKSLVLLSTLVNNSEETIKLRTYLKRKHERIQRYLHLLETRKEAIVSILLYEAL